MHNEKTQQSQNYSPQPYKALFQNIFYLPIKCIYLYLCDRNRNFFCAENYEKLCTIWMKHGFLSIPWQI